MMCFRDMAFCSNAEQCMNKGSCLRWFSPSQEAEAKQWWGSDGAPVAFMEFKDCCDNWEEVSK